MDVKNVQENFHSCLLWNLFVILFPILVIIFPICTSELVRLFTVGATVSERGGLTHPWQCAQEDNMPV